MDAASVVVEIDGRPAYADRLWQLAVPGYGHFTAMQVRGRRTRGLDLHLARLSSATQELFDAVLDPGQVRERIRHALGDDIRDASVRVYVLATEAVPSMVVTVKPPAEAPNRSQRLKSAPLLRALPHVKHAGGFVQEHWGRLARRDGFDDALFVAPDGAIAEAAIANLGLVDGDTVVWPDAPALAGITMQLLERALAERGTPSRRTPVRLGDAASFHGAFVCNSRGLAPVSQIDDIEFAVDAARMAALRAAYESVAWDEL